MTPEFAALLKDAIGLDASSIGLSAIERAVAERSAACGLEDSREYFDRVRGSTGELQQLIDAVVVPETWFFRDEEAFGALGTVVQQQWRAEHSSGPFRLLSLPCSTGEEPYSIAMALLDAGFPSAGFSIDAVDVCERSLAKAQRAVYGRVAFRAADQSFRERYFEPVTHGHRLTETVQRQVHFRRDNLFTFGSSPSTGQYDVIFCRNLMIYFDEPTQRRALSLLTGLLTPGGYLFVGSAESAIVPAGDFSSLKLALAFAFRRLDPQAARAAARKARKTPPPPRGGRVSLAQARPVPSGRKARPVPPRSDGLDDAARLADEGRLADAAACCDRYLHEHGPHARAFYLLGLVRDAAGRHDDADACYRKALYLDPQHSETLAQLVLLSERAGRAAEARLLRERLARATAKAGDARC